MPELGYAAGAGDYPWAEQPVEAWQAHGPEREPAKQEPAWGRGQEPFGGSPSGGLFVRYRRGHPLGVVGKRVGHVRFIRELGGHQLGTGSGHCQNPRRPSPHQAERPRPHPPGDRCLRDGTGQSDLELRDQLRQLVVAECHALECRQSVHRHRANHLDQFRILQ